jgi:hypothetical protein
MKRLSWSKLFTLAALVSLGIVTHGVATAQVTPRAPVTQIPGSRVPSASPGTTNLKAWEGFQTTNYLNTEQYLYTRSVASIATGPTNIITIVNRRIAMFDNPNAIISPGGPGSATTQKTVSGPTAYPPTHEALLDAWLGENLLKTLCPTNTSGTVSGGSTISCLVDHATVRYDQLQGRFLVLMTVTDTGIATPGQGVTSARKASWVLLISKYATFPSLGTNGSSDVFINPTPPVGSTSGINPANWAVYYGSGSDGFIGSIPANGNINSLPAIAGADATFDCSAGAIAASGATPAKNCYFPTDARLGIDNDNIIITSPVVNVNYFLPPAGTPVPTITFAGTRVRVIKKGGASPSAGGSPIQSPGSTAAGLYQKSLAGGALTAGNQFDEDTTKDYYDLYANAGNIAPLSTFSAGYANAPYTVGPPTDSITNGKGLFCEPARVRGRAAASYTNSMTPGAVTSQTYLECITSVALAPGSFTSSIFVQPIQYVTAFGGINPPANQGNTVPYYPILVGTGTVAPNSGMQVAQVDPFSNPSTVAQASYLGTSGGPSGTAPNFYVGDDRPHELIMREGHLYSARVGSSPLLFQVNQAPLSTTVYYDIIQKLTAGNPGITSTAPLAAGAPSPVLLSKWTNTNAWAPQYEVPANVTTQGQTDPNFVFPWLEKLFVATSYPPMAGSDPRTSVQAGVNCTNNGVTPNIVGGIANAGFSYPGLYDQRCATDAFDAFISFRNPVTGQIVTTIPDAGAAPMIAPSLRGSASTDPNDGSLWNFGLYATRRFGVINGTGQQGSYVSNYDLQFQSTDAHNNPIGTQFTDCVSASTCGSATYLAVQIAANQGLISNAPGAAGIANNVLRGQMAKLVMLSLMDEKAIQAYLQATGGCTTNFNDVASDCNGGVSGGTVPLAASSNSNWRYIESMYRKHITTGCFANDAVRNFCPTDPLTRGQMAVFLIRAKMNNVYPSVLNGCSALGVCAGVAGGDGFGLSVPSTPYFTDVASNHAYFPYIQKMYELRITNGVTPIPGIASYGVGDNLKLGQLLTFVVRAFFY